MNNEKDFYDIIRSKFDNKELPFSDEKNWNSMRKMIDESRKAKDRAIWLLASFGLLLCAGGAFAIYETTSTGGKTKIASANYSPAIGKSNSPIINNTVISSSPSNSESPTAGNKSPDNLLNSQPNQSNSNNNPIAANNSLYQNSSLNKPRHLKSSTQEIVSTNSDDNTTSAVKIEQPVTTTPGKNGIGNQNLTSKEVSTALANRAPKANSTIEATVHKTDSTVTGNGLPQRFSDEPRIFRSKKNFISVDAGVSWSGGWDYGSTTQGHGFYPLMGVGYMHYLKAKLFVKTGLQFSIFDNMNSIPYVVTHETGNLASYSVITTKNLYYLTIPIQLELYLGNKNAIGFGGSVSRLLSSSNTGTTYEQYDNNPPINVQPLSHIATLSGYSSWNTTVYLFYKWTLNRKFSMYVMPYFGLTDIKNNSFFGTNLFERDKGMRILLSYNL